MKRRDFIISILYKKTGGKFEPMYWEKTRLKMTSVTYGFLFTRNVMWMFFWNALLPPLEMSWTFFDCVKAPQVVFMFKSTLGARVGPNNEHKSEHEYQCPEAILKAYISKQFKLI